MTLRVVKNKSVKESSPESHEPLSCPLSIPPFFACLKLRSFTSLGPPASSWQWVWPWYVGNCFGCKAESSLHLHWWERNTTADYTCNIHSKASNLLSYFTTHISTALRTSVTRPSASLLPVSRRWPEDSRLEELYMEFLQARPQTTEEGSLPYLDAQIRPAWAGARNKLQGDPTKSHILPPDTDAINLNDIYENASKTWISTLSQSNIKRIGLNFILSSKWVNITASKVVSISLKKILASGCRHTHIQRSHYTLPPHRHIVV